MIKQLDPEPIKNPEIINEMQQLDFDISTLKDSLKVLCERLLPILSNEKPTCDGEVEKSQELCRHAEDIRNFGYRIYNLNIIIKDVISRLQI